MNAQLPEFAGADDEDTSVPIGVDTRYYCGTELLIHYDGLRASVLPALLTLQIVLGTYHYSQLLGDGAEMALSVGLYLWFAISELFVLGIMLIVTKYIEGNHRLITRYLSHRKFHADGDEGPVGYLARGSTNLAFVGNNLTLVLGGLIFLGCLAIGALKFLGIM